MQVTNFETKHWRDVNVFKNNFGLLFSPDGTIRTACTALLASCPSLSNLKLHLDIKQAQTHHFHHYSVVKTDLHLIFFQLPARL